jgi:hypothetical protein
MRPLVAHCHAGLWTLYRRIGDRAKGDEALAIASAMCREMDMGFWLENVEPSQLDPKPRRFAASSSRQGRS